MVTDFKKRGTVSQTFDCFMNRLKLFMNKGDWKYVLFGAVIAWIVAWIVGKDMFKTYDGTKSGFFTIVSASIWIGIFNSVQLICKEKRIVKYEHRQLGRRMSSYILGNVAFEFWVCLLQASIVLAICTIYINFPEKGIIFSQALVEYFITIFLIIFSSDTMGLFLSSLVKTETAAMTAMPFLLILQLVMSGVLFKLEGISALIAHFTIGKWGMAAMGAISDINSPELPLKISLIYPNVMKSDIDVAYESTVENIVVIWFVLVSFIFIFTFLSICRMEMIDKEQI